MELSAELLCRIFDYLSDGRDLSRCYAVCRVWRNECLIPNGEERWKALCQAHGLPTTLNQALQRRQTRYQAQRETAISAKAKTRPTKKRKPAQEPQLHRPSFVPACFAFKDHYIAVRTRLCRRCRAIKSQTLHYPMEFCDEETGVRFPLCFGCRSTTYPMAVLTATQLVASFKPFGITTPHVLLEQPDLDRMEVSFGSTRGNMYRLVDVVEMAKRLVVAKNTNVANDTTTKTATQSRRKRRNANQTPKTVEDVEHTHQELRSTMLDVSDPAVRARELLHLY